MPVALPEPTVSGMAFRFGFAPTVTSSNPCKTMGGTSETTASKVGATAASKRSLGPAKWVEQERSHRTVRQKAPSCWKLTIAPGCGTRLVA